MKLIQGTYVTNISVAAHQNTVVFRLMWSRCKHQVSGAIGNQGLVTDEARFRAHYLGIPTTNISSTH